MTKTHTNQLPLCQRQTLLLAIGEMAQREVRTRRLALIWAERNGSPNGPFNAAQLQRQADRQAAVLARLRAAYLRGVTG